MYIRTLIFLIALLLTLLSCNRLNFSNRIIETNNELLEIYFLEQPVDYASNAIKYSKFTKNVDIVDEDIGLDSVKLNRIKRLSIYPKNTMNFINPYNDTLNVVFSFPRRLCLKNQKLKDYLDNFSTSMQYIIIDNGNKVRFDSIRISHETRIVPPIDCKDQKKYIGIPSKLNNSFINN